ncbi:MAG: tetratricopeptide repeat-containing glycosyltransferase family protein [Planctomycetota bacterium]
MPTVADLLAKGWKVHQAGQVDDALRVYEHVIRQAPANPEAYVYRGIAEFDQRQFQDSVSSYRHALSLREAFPIAWNNLGNSLRMLGEVEESDQCFERALELDGSYLSALKNRGTLWVWSGEIERGLRWYERGLEIVPEDPELHRNLGVIFLLQGDFRRGWEEYRWRWRMPGMQRPPSSATLWQGQPISGRSILLYPEQGRGDEINFIRMATLLAERGARVTVRVDSAMIPLFTSVRGVQSLIPQGGQLPLTDYHASFFDAVDGWYQWTGEMPYGEECFYDYGSHNGYLNVSDALVRYWRNWFESHDQGSGKRKRVGIVWQGNPKHHADVYRSLPLECFGDFANDPAMSLISLQFGYGKEQLEQVAFGDAVLRLPTDTDTTGGAFTDTAAVMKNLDHVVTSDTSLAHLAGALGVPTTVILGKVPDWRWLEQGEVTRWYPNVKLQRQRNLGDWSGVMRRAHQSVQEAIG